MVKAKTGEKGTLEGTVETMILSLILYKLNAICRKSLKLELLTSMFCSSVYFCRNRSRRYGCRSSKLSRNPRACAF